MKQKVIITSALFWLLLTGLEAQKPGQVADSANAAYKQGAYQKALMLYDSVYQMGFHSADLYYNMANSYFKTDEIPRAILFYERALKLDPGNEDIRQNLAMAQELTMDKIEKVPELFYQKWWRNIRNKASADEWSKAGIITFILFLALLAFFLLSGRVWIKKMTFYSGIVVFLIMVFSFIFAVKQHNNLVREQDAIIFKPSVTVKSSPDQNSVDLFVIHEGTKVYILDRLGEWYEIRIDNGSVGWIRQQTVEVI